MLKNGSFEKEKQKKEFDHSLIFSWLHFLFSLVFTLSFSNHGCNGGKEEKIYFALRIIHVFVHACEACCGHLSIFFVKRLGEVCNIELGLWEYGAHGVKNKCMDL